MANGQISKLLEFANMQMAAEAFLTRVDDTLPNQPPPGQIRDRLVEGNFHPSHFMPAQADQFVADYEVLRQYRNDPTLPGQSGFSGTLFKNKTTGELTLSFRSTEFIDDAVRDSKSTNELEIKDLGWAFGQIAEMEQWYAQLCGSSSLLADGNGGIRNFNVTGYSLGGHLATAFNILRREESAATGAPNPVIATYTFNGAGTGAILDGRRLTDIVSDFNRIRADYTASPEWTSLSVGDQNTVSALAQSRVDAINAEAIRVAGLSGVTRAFAASAPSGSQTSLGYQIAALLVGQNTIGASNFPLPGGTNYVPSSPVYAPDALRFPNMTEIVGMETGGLATSFVSNSGVHYGYRQEVAIEGQPMFRGNFLISYLLGFNMLVDNPSTNDFADTHSLVLVVDSLSLMAAMEKLASNLTIETAGQILAAMSNAAASSSIGTQGEAEGDTLERALDAMRKLVLGPGLDPTLDQDQMIRVLEGNTWHDKAYRAPFQDRLEELRDRITALTALNETFVVDSLVSIDAAQLAAIAGSSEAMAYRYALKELNPFAVVGDTANAAIYGWHNLAGELDLYSAAERTGTLTSEWITDRAAFLSWKNPYFTANGQTTLRSTRDENYLFENRDSAGKTDLSLTVVGNLAAGGNSGAAANPAKVVFGNTGTEVITGGILSDRLYGDAGTDWLEGKANSDYLEGGTGLDIYNYNALSGFFGISGNDGADVIRDVDGKGVLRYVFNNNGTLNSTIIADASMRVSGTQWNSADGRFTYLRSQNDLIITINGDAGGSITLRDFRDGDFNIHLWEARADPQITGATIIGDLQPQDFDPNTPGIQTQTDALGNVIVTTNPEVDRNDVLNDSTGNDRIIAGGGNDILRGIRGSDDWMSGDAGRDNVAGGVGGDLIEGGADGVFDGESGGDIAYGDVGNDEIYADTKIALAGAITQGNTGSASNATGDYLSGGGGDDWIVGAVGDDYLDGGSGQDLIVGGAGSDNIVGDYGFVALSPLWVVDRVVTSQDGLTLYSLNFVSGSVSGLDGGAGAADVIYAGAGIDWVFAGEGDDYVDGGPGNDVAFGMEGNDVLIGGAGNDNLVGDNGPGGTNDGADYLDGGAGDDKLQGDGGNDVLIGGPGNDTLSGGAGKDIYVFNKGDGTDTVFDTDTAANSPDASVVVIGDGVNRSDVKFRVGSLAVDLGPSDPADPNSAHDVIHFEGFDQVNPTATTPLGEIRFADGTSLGYADILTQGFDIDGTEGNDDGQLGDAAQLVGTGVVDRISGFGGNDILGGLTGDDVLDGGAGNDQILGGGGADIVNGGDGDDVIWGDTDQFSPLDEGNDVLSGGLGNDIIYANGGNDSIFGDDGNDTLWGQSGADVLEGGAGDDYLGGDALYFFNGIPMLNLFDDNAVDALRGGDGNDTLNSGGGDDVLEGGAGADRLEAEAGNDVLSGGDDDDQLIAGDGNDALNGDAGNDTLWGGAGDDVISGGAGSDTLLGEGGNDTYLLSLEDGEDVLSEQSDTTLDRLRFGSGIATGDITFSHGANSALVAWHSNGVDQMTIQNWYAGATNKLDYFEFADGTQITAAQAETSALTSYRGGSGNDVFAGSSSADTMYGLAGNDSLFGNAGNDTLIGGTGNDTLVGGTGADVYRFGLGDGADLIQETGLIDDRLIFEANVASTDISYDRVGSDLIMRHANGADSVTVYNWFDPAFSYKLQSLTFESDGTTFSTSQLDTLATVIAHQYTLNLGDGAKLIDDWGGIDTLTFGAGIAKADIQLARVGVDLTLTHTNGTDRVTIKDWFNDVVKQIEQVVFADTGESFSHAELTDPFLTLNGTAGNDTITGGNAYGEVLNGLAGNDVIDGNGGNDQLTGGLGNDTLSGGDGADRYYFKAGDGADMVVEADGFTNVIQFGPGMVNNVNFGSIGNDQLITFTGSGDSVRVQETGFGSVVAKFELNGTSAADTLTGSSFGDVIQGLGGNDVIHGGDGADEIYGGPGNDTLEGGADTFSGRLDALYGGDGDDILDAGLMTDTGDPGGSYTGGPGNDTLNGNSGADTYFFNVGDGQDVIDDEPFVSGITYFFSGDDQISFGPGITADTLSGTRSGNDLVVIVSPTDRITIKNQLFDPAYQIDKFIFSDGGTLNTAGINALQFIQRGTSGNDTLTGADGSNDSLFGFGGNDTLTGLSGDDLLDGGTGNDVLNGGAGDDRYIFNAGYGQDQITDSGGTDTVQFGPGLTASDIMLGRNINSLVLSVNGTADSVTITNYLSDPASRVENFTFTDGSQLPGEAAILDQLGNVRGTTGDDVLTGTAGFDVMYGLEGNDTLNALADNDTLYGGADNDTLNGGAGNDSLFGEDGNDDYQYAVGDGQDTVFDTSGSDSVVFGSGISTTAVTTTRNVSDLYLNVNVTGNPGKVAVQNYFNGQETEEIRFADGTIWDVATVRAKVLAASETSSNDVVYGYETNDTISSLAGNDTVYAGAGNDVIDGGLGSDALYGEDGDDVINAGSGDSNKASVANNLYGGNGNDMLIASGKPDQLFGGPGNDIYRGGAGVNWLEDSGGNNVMDGLSGNDQLWGGDQNDLVIGNTGNDSFDGDRDANGVRGRDVVLFNKVDGTDTVFRLGTGSTLSIGGGTLYSNLSLSASGNSLTLKVGTSTITFTDWYSGNKAVSTLQDVIEGTRDYSASSTDPMKNKKIQAFDFLGLVSVFDVARAAGKTFNVANNLSSYRLSGSDTDAIGGAIAFTYAKSSSISTLTYDQMRAVISDPAFAVGAQPITASAAASASASAEPIVATDTLAAFSSATDAALVTDAGSTASGSSNANAAPYAEMVSGIGAAPVPGAPDRTEVRVIPELRTHGQAALAGADSRIPPVSAVASSKGLAATPEASTARAPHAAAPTGALDEGAGFAPKEEAVAATDTSAGVSAQTVAPHRGATADDALEGLAADWFNRRSPNEDLSLLDDIARGEGGVNAPTHDAVGAAWVASHRWLSQYAKARKDAGEAAADGAGLSDLSMLGAGSSSYDIPRAVVGLRDVSGHYLTSFRGLREGVSMVAQP